MHTFNLPLDCRHNHLSIPITLKPAQQESTTESVTGTYVVCLDCGKEFPYDWKDLGVLPLIEARDCRYSNDRHKNLAN